MNVLVEKILYADRSNTIQTYIFLLFFFLLILLVIIRLITVFALTGLLALVIIRATAAARRLGARLLVGVAVRRGLFGIVGTTRVGILGCRVGVVGGVGGVFANQIVDFFGLGALIRRVVLLIFVVIVLVTILYNVMGEGKCKCEHMQCVPCTYEYSVT